MIYKQEAGAIITPNREILHLFDGNPGSVDFDPEVIWTYHQQNPGSVFALAHVHPSAMFSLSGTDEQLLKGWAIALYPWPVRVVTIAALNRQPHIIRVVETHYLGQFETKESWLKRKFSDPLTKSRRFEIIQTFRNTEEVWEEDLGITNGDFSWYGQVLLKRSYRNELD